MKTILHVDQAVIRKNTKLGESNPPLIVRNYKHSVRAKKVRLVGPVDLVFSPDKPLACGARVWMETKQPVWIEDDPNNPQEFK